MAESTTSPEIDGTAYFERRGDIYHPRSIARGGWGALISGHVVGGLLGRAVEQLVDDSDFLPARLTVDLPRPCAIEPIEVHTRDIRSGKRLRLVEAVIRQDDKVVGQASGLFLRRGEQPTGTDLVTSGRNAADPNGCAAECQPVVRPHLWLGHGDPESG